MSKQIIHLLFLSLIAATSFSALANEDRDLDRPAMAEMEGRRAEMAERFANMSEEERAAVREEFQNMDPSERRARFEDSEMAERLRNMTPEEREVALERLREFNQNRGNFGEETL